LPGDVVIIKTLRKTGRIAKVREGMAEVMVGSMRFKVPTTELSPISQEEKAYSLSKEAEAYAQNQPSRGEERINILGFDVETALTEVEKQINSCFLQGKTKLLIVHGHGTGRLRQALWDYLKDHPLVERFEPAPIEKGGTGATVVYIVPR
jgi:DNA mismatch repair protein MutS2